MKDSEPDGVSHTMTKLQTLVQTRFFKISFVCIFTVDKTDFSDPRADSRDLAGLTVGKHTSIPLKKPG